MKDRSHTEHRQGTSLAKGPVAIVGLLLLAYAVVAFILGGNEFTASPGDGTVDGETFLGIETNGWTNVLLAGAGLLLLFGSPFHWGAKTTAMIVGLVLGAASVIAMADGSDVFGIFAANGPTMLLLGAAAAALLILSLLPRIGKRKHRDGEHRDRDVIDADERPVRTRERVVEREPGAEREREAVTSTTDRDARFTREPVGEERPVERR